MPPGTPAGPVAEGAGANLQAILPLVYYRAAGFLNEFPLVRFGFLTTHRANLSWWYRQGGLEPEFTNFQLRGNRHGNRNRQVV
jgi:hypothetical protein